MTLPTLTLLPTSQRRRFHDRAGLTALVLTYSAGLTAWLLLTPGLAAPWHALGAGLAVAHWSALGLALLTLPPDAPRDSMWSTLLLTGVLVGVAELVGLLIALGGIGHAS